MSPCGTFETSILLLRPPLGVFGLLFVPLGEARLIHAAVGWSHDGAESLTLIDMTAGLTFSTMSANPAGRAISAACAGASNDISRYE